MSLSTIAGVALSGLNAQNNVLSSAAETVANADTADYQPLDSEGSPEGGVDADATPHRSRRSVDLSTAMLEVAEAEVSYRANVAAFEAGADFWDVLSVIIRD